MTFKDQAVTSVDGISPVHKSTSNESRQHATSDNTVYSQSKHYISGMLSTLKKK
jgi:hypothetical protein